MEIEIGKGKMARRAYGFDEVAIVPSRRTRDPDDVDISWQIDAYTFDLPMMAAAMDAGVSPATAVRIGQLGGLACLNLEGLWTRYEDPEPIYEEIATLPDEKATGACRSCTASRSRTSSWSGGSARSRRVGSSRAPRSPRSASSGSPRRSSAPASTSS